MWRILHCHRVWLIELWDFQAGFIFCPWVKDFQSPNKLGMSTVQQERTLGSCCSWRQSCLHSSKSTFSKNYLMLKRKISSSARRQVWSFISVLKRRKRKIKIALNEVTWIFPFSSQCSGPTQQKDPEHETLLWAKPQWLSSEGYHTKATTVTANY